MGKGFEIFPVANSFWDNFGLIIPKGPYIHIKPEEDMPTVIILCGIPTSGKSTWVTKLTRNDHYDRDDFRSYYILSRDQLRLDIYGKNYKPSQDKEKFITGHFNALLDKLIQYKRPIILDNTHCKESYLKEALKRFEGTEYVVKIKFFDLPLWKAYYRNIKRYLMTGKWIPWSVIKSMKKNYDKINKKDYAKYKI